MKTVIPMVIVAILVPVNARATCNYPCEIDNPDESQRWAVPCVDAPEGTAIENEPCKECDGSGEIQNKDDGAACTINGKPGECCEGTCYEIPGEGEDPCDWANSNQGLFPANAQQQVYDDPNCYGYVMCINGEEYPCIVEDHVAAAYPSWANEVLACITVHEQTHIEQKVNCPPCGVAAGTGPSDEEEARQLECEAYKAEWDCLAALDTFNTDGCAAAMELARQNMIDRNCPNTP
jgi:hypothetical protein